MAASVMSSGWARPLAIPPLARDELHVWRASLTAGGGTVQRLAQWLSPDERARAARFVFDRDRNRYVLARGVLRQLLGAYLATPPAALCFAYGPAGKPAIDQPTGGRCICFNLSHSGDLAVYVIGRARPVGIDIERVRDDISMAGLVTEILSPAEQAALIGRSDADRRLALFRGWVRTEAYVKARGDGLAQLAGQAAASARLAEMQNAPVATPTVDAAWSWYLLDVDVGYVAAVVAAGPPAALRTFDYIVPTAEAHPDYAGDLSPGGPSEQ